MEIMIDFKLNQNNLAGLIQKLKELDYNTLWTVTVRPFKHTRSLDQNERYWKLVTAIGDYMGYEKDEMHELMAYKFLSEHKEVKGEKIVKIKSTASLNTKDMTDYQKDIEIWAKQYGFVFNDEHLTVSV
tara:strand:+ start:631 stop:1017 length:387 start_codon:yes stop_codon:yes gene_type:complete